MTHRLNAPFGAQCFPTGKTMPKSTSCGRVSMHLLVLSAFRPTEEAMRSSAISGSQCTFWCSVLSDATSDQQGIVVLQETGLNAPFGAQCFPTWASTKRCRCSTVSMHLLVLSAFRQCYDGSFAGGSGVSMHLLVLSAFRRKTSGRPVGALERLNAPFGAQCFPTQHPGWAN